MKIIADENIPLLDETFGAHGEVLRLSGRDISRMDLLDADVLLVRSVTQVKPALLSGTAVRFVGSATIGTDHLDIDWLKANDIAWAHAPACNADAAAQYTLAMMWLACERCDLDFMQQEVGIVGRGNVGSRLEHLLKALGIAVVACDPPLQDAGQDGLVSMARACEGNIITLHVPLTTRGDYPTRHLFDRQRLAGLKPDTLLVNAARGGVIDAQALLAELQAGRLHAALDVWPDEPLIATDLLSAVCVATPHVAGYSVEGKQTGTDMIYHAFCEAFSLQPVSLPAPRQTPLEVDFPTTLAVAERLKHSIQGVCPVARDDAVLRAQCREHPRDGHVHIDRLRANYPARHEFKAYRAPANLGLNLSPLGFQPC